MLFSQIKTPSDLKALVENNPKESFFFNRKTMKFFGDTMRNYGVRHVGELIELYRKNPVKHGLQDSRFWKGSQDGTYAVRAKSDDIKKALEASV